MQTKKRFNPGVAATIVAAHLIAAGALWYALTHGYWYSTTSWAIFVALFFLTAFGITAGYHRMLTHGGFRCHPFLRVLFSIFGGMASMGGEYRFIANHRVHHFCADLPGDPHSPREYPGVMGLLWAHIVWLFFYYERPPKYATFRDLDEDPVVSWQKRWYVPIVTASFLIPGLIAGCAATLTTGFIIPEILLACWEGILIGGFLRIVMVWNITWSVNSICHWWGTRARDSLGHVYRANDSRNNILVAFLGFGEGYHANHHVQPRWAYHGWRWYDVDPTKWLLMLLERLGLIWDVRKPDKSVVFLDETERPSRSIASHAPSA